ncbi:MAG: hypothetical protein JW867_02270 [Candidatus Omnitrophica bacterium]|nr:hypothetical protein [Candidatus Omnitrophota bacterium]
MVIKRVSSQPAPQPAVLLRHPLAEPPREQRRDTRPMYNAICADCRTPCQIPFRPSPDRPVYCKECYRARKKNGIFKPRTDESFKNIAPVYTQVPKEAKALKGSKPIKKKPSGKNKPSRKK